MNFTWNFLGLGIPAQEGQQHFLLGMDLDLSTRLVRASHQEATAALQEVIRHKDPAKVRKFIFTEEASPVFLNNWVKGGRIGLVTEAR